MCSTHKPKFNQEMGVSALLSFTVNQSIISLYLGNHLHNMLEVVFSCPQCQCSNHFYTQDFTVFKVMLQIKNENLKFMYFVQVHSNQTWYMYMRNILFTLTKHGTVHVHEEHIIHSNQTWYMRNMYIKNKHNIETNRQRYIHT